MRKRAKVFLVLAGCWLAAMGAVWLSLPNRSVTVANCAHVREGMSLQEVELLFDSPAVGNIPGAACRDPEGVRECSEVKYWPGIGGEAQIGFDQDKRVRGVIYWRSQETFFDRVRLKAKGWLGL